MKKHISTQIRKALLCFFFYYVVSVSFGQKSGGGGTPPATPPNFNVSTNLCGSKTLTRVGTPPSGVIWYWTDNANPDIATFFGSGTTCTVNSSHTYFLLPYVTSTRTYGTANLANVTINSYPAAPPAASISQQCAASVLTESSAPGGVTYYWQDMNSGGQSTANSSTTYNALSSGTYYIGAKSSAGCWSSNTAISVTVKPLPATPPTPIATTNNCGIKILSYSGTPPGTVQWIWQGGQPNGTGTLDNGSTFPAYATSTFYLRALDNGCWSTNSSQLSVTVNPIPLAPTSIVSISGTEGSAFPLSATPGRDGTVINWYAASTGGTSLATSNVYNPVLTSTTVFYTTSLNSTSGCESTPRTAITVNVNPSPVILTSAPAIIHGQGITLSLSNTYDTYSWKRNNIEIATTPTTYITTPGVYTVTVTKSTLTGVGISPSFTAVLQYQMNYVIKNQMQKSGVNTVAAADLLTIGDCQRSVTYAGGFGNPVQTILPQYSPLKKDFIQPVEYTPNGRQIKKYLPYANGDNGGAYRGTAINNAGYLNSDQYQFYQNTATKIATDTKPYATMAVEPSPLQRILSQTGPGATWQDNQISNKASYMLSRASDNIRLWSLDASGLPIPSGVYSDYMLTKTISYDENNNSKITFTDTEGQVVQQSQQASSTDWLQTIYIYNDLNQLVYILQPEGVRNLSGNPSQVFLDTWAFQFHYDALGRKIESKAPGAGWEYLVYDNLDRPLLSQNANQRTISQWTFVKYDVYGRPIMTGLKLLTGYTRASLQTQVTSQTNQYEIPQNSVTGYTLNMTFPAAAETNLLTVTYYDNYNFLSYTGWDAENHSYSFVSELGNSAPSAFTTGLLTGSKKRIVTATGTTGTWLNGVQYYDDHYRLIQTVSENHKNGLDRSTNLLNVFTGRLEQNLFTEGTGGITVLKKYGYDHVNRLQKIWQNINNAQSDQLVVQYEYNELGQLVDKKLHGNGTSFLQSVDYRYGIRGWLRSVNGAQLVTGNDNEDSDSSSPDYFGMDLMYEATDASLGNTPAFNGNISAIKYKGLGSATGMPDQKANVFIYDQADRLLTTSTKMYGTIAWNKNVGVNNETFNYDYNGNIKSLNRSHCIRTMSSGTLLITPEVMDNLAYTYASGNQLSKVDDSVPLAVGVGDFKDGSNTTTEYGYDGTGNLSSDANKGISAIAYNALNLVQRITFTDGRHVDYTYDASGVKLFTQTFSSSNVLQTTNDYINGFVFVNNVLNFFGSPEGRIVKNGSTYEYQYSISDNQGNTRVVFSAATPVAQTASASFENATEASSFDQYPSTSGISSMYNHTVSGAKSQLLNGGYSSMVGVAKSYKVFTGDKLKIEAYARYTAPTTSNSSGLVNFATALLGAFNVAPPAAGEANTVAAALNNVGTLAAGGWGDGSTDNTDPKAFVNIIIFDKNYNFLDVAFAQVSSLGAFTYLSASYTVKETGYAFVYVSNEQPVQTDVYFDDVKMTYTPTNIVQYNEYYSHGMQNSDSWTRDNSTNNFLYNGASELNNLTAMYDLAFRNYDATLGRFHQVDPMASSTLSTYQYSNNNPILFNDPMGLDPGDKYRHDPPQKGKRTIDIDWYASFVDSHQDLLNRIEFDEGFIEQRPDDDVTINTDGSITFNKLGFTLTPFGKYNADPATMEEISGTRTIDGYTVDAWPRDTFSMLHGPNESFDFDWFLETSQSGNYYRQTAVMIFYHTKKEDMFTVDFGQVARVAGRTRSFSVDAGGPHNFQELPFEPSQQMLDMMEGSKQYHCRCLEENDVMLNVLKIYWDFISAPDPNHYYPFDQKKKPKMDPGNGIHK